MTSIIEVTTFGAVGDCKTVNDASISSGSHALSSTTAAFTSADAGKAVIVFGAGAAGIPLITTITSVAAGVATLSGSAASTTVTNAMISYGTDNHTAITNAITNLDGYGGITLYFTPGDYLSTQPNNITRKKLKIKGGPNVIWRTAIATGNAGQAYWFADNASAFPSSSTLAANVARGDSTIQLTSNIVVKGDMLVLYPMHWGGTGGLRAQSYFVRSVTGSGPYTVTLDRPVRESFVSITDMAYKWLPTTDFVIDGDGALMTGYTVRYIEMQACVRCKVMNIRADDSGGTASDIAFSFDTAGMLNEFSGLDIMGTGVYGAALESNWASRIVNSRFCHQISNSSSGVTLFACSSCLISDVKSTGNIYGVSLGSDGFTLSCDSTEIRGGEYSGNVWGINNIMGNLDTKIIGAKFSGNTDGGTSGGAILLDSSIAASTGTRVIGCDFIDNNIGVYGNNGHDDTHFIGCDFGGSKVYAMYLGDGRWAFTNCFGTMGSAPTRIAELEGGEYSFLGGRWKNVAVSNNFNLAANSKGFFGGGMHITLDGSGSDAIAANAASAIATVDNLTVEAVHSTGTYGVSSTGLAWIGNGYDGYSCATPLNGTTSRGTVTASGVTGVDVTFAGIKPQSIVILTPKTAAGTRGKIPTVTITAGTKFTIFADAGDTSVYYWEVQ